MRAVLLFIGATGNAVMAVTGVLTHRPELLLWAAGNCLLLALGAVLSPSRPGDGEQ